MHQVSWEVAVERPVAVEPRQSTRWLIVAGIAGLVVLAGWFVTSMYQPAASKECLRRYRAARSAADSAEVDAFVPGGGRDGNPEAHRCGFIRTSARWQ
jgi:hypothetical protein